MLSDIISTKITIINKFLKKNIYLLKTFLSMYLGTISSIFDNPFKYNIKLQELPFGLMSKINDEVYVLSDLGKRKLFIDIETFNELIYLKSNQVNLWIQINKSKIKVSLKNVTIKKSSENNYELFYEFILF